MLVLSRRSAPEPCCVPRRVWMTLFGFITACSVDALPSDGPAAQPKTSAEELRIDRTWNMVVGIEDEDSGALEVESYDAWARSEIDGRRASRAELCSAASGVLESYLQQGAKTYRRQGLEVDELYPEARVTFFEVLAEDAPFIRRLFAPSFTCRGRLQYRTAPQPRIRPLSEAVFDSFVIHFIGEHFALPFDDADDPKVDALCKEFAREIALHFPEASSADFVRSLQERLERRLLQEHARFIEAMRRSLLEEVELQLRIRRRVLARVEAIEGRARAFCGER